MVSDEKWIMRVRKDKDLRMTPRVFLEHMNEWQSAIWNVEERGFWMTTLGLVCDSIFKKSHEVIKMAVWIKIVDQC